MAFLKQGPSTLIPPKRHLNPILVTGIWHVGVLTVLLFSLSSLIGEPPKIDHPAAINTKNGQTRSISLPQEGEKNA
jgi:hypothetical protein